VEKYENKDSIVITKNKAKTPVISWQNRRETHLVGRFLFYISMFILLLSAAELFRSFTYSIWGVETQASIHHVINTHSRNCVDCNEIYYSYSLNGSEEVFEVVRMISDSQLSRLVENNTLSITYLAILPSNSIFGHTWDDLGINIFCIVVALFGASLGKVLLLGKFAVIEAVLPKLKIDEAA
jgi:hypothetical protein